MSGGHDLHPGTRTVLAKSCAKCGHFKQAREYRRFRGGKYLQAWCLACVYRASKEAEKVANQLSHRSADRSYEPWTEFEVKLVRRLTERGHSNREIGLALGRSVRAVSTAKQKYLREGDEEHA